VASSSGRSFKLDADASPLFLKRCPDEASLLFGGAFQSELQAHAILFGEGNPQRRESCSARAGS